MADVAEVKTDMIYLHTFSERTKIQHKNEQKLKRRAFSQLKNTPPPPPPPTSYSPFFFFFFFLFSISVSVVSLSLCLSVCLSVSLSVCLSVCLSVSPSPPPPAPQIPRAVKYNSNSRLKLYVPNTGGVAQTPTEEPVYNILQHLGAQYYTQPCQSTLQADTWARNTI